MALLTVSTESVLTKAGNFVLTASLVHGLAANLASARAHSILLGILRLQGKRRNSALARKRGIVIVSAEFGYKQSHEIGSSSWPWSLPLQKDLKIFQLEVQACLLCF